MKKDSAGEPDSVPLVRNPDILAELGYADPYAKD